MKFVLTLIFFILYIFLIPCRAQSDDTLRVLNEVKHVDTLYAIAAKISPNDPKKARLYGQHLLNVSEKENHPAGISLGLITIGNALRHEGEYDSALVFYRKGLDLAQQNGYQKGIALVSTSMGTVYASRGDYETALKYYLPALDLAEKQQDKMLVSRLLNNIAIIYSRQHNYAGGIAYHERALKIRGQLGDKSAVAFTLNNLAAVYYQAKDTLRSLQIHERSLALSTELNDQAGIALSLCNLGEVYFDQGHYAKASFVLQKALRIRQSLSDQKGLIEVYENLGTLYQRQKIYSQAVDSYQNALVLAQKLDSRYDRMRMHKFLAESYLGAGDYKASALAWQQHVKLAEAQNEENNARQIADMQARYESTQKEKEIALLNKDREMQQVEIDNERSLRNSFLGSAALLLILVLVVGVAYQEKRKANQQVLIQNKMLEQQKEEILAQNEEIVTQHREIETKNRMIELAFEDLQRVNYVIQDKNRKISDSLNYAKRLQAAILPPLRDIQTVFPESFVLFKPRDVVSGDFYYFARNEHRLVLSAIDCTGHGIPGAFMSMIGYELLNQIILTDKIYEPSQVLERMHTGVVAALRQEEEDSKSSDGMDMVLCSIDLKNNELQVAGAQNPLLLFNPERGEPMMEIRGDKRAIGGKYGGEVSFSSHRISLQQGDTIYLFSDGYADQFGGSQNKKFMIKRFRQLLADIQPLPMTEQKQVLERELAAWMGSHEQVDDILVIGVRMNLVK